MYLLLSQDHCGARLFCGLEGISLLCIGVAGLVSLFDERPVRMIGSLVCLFLEFSGILISLLACHPGCRSDTLLASSTLIVSSS